MSVNKTTSKARKLFSTNLRAFRKEKGISQEELAYLSGLHRTYVGSVERGERNISIDNIERLAEALNIKITDLLYDGKK